MSRMEEKEERRRYWREQVVVWQASGLGVADYARKQGVNPRRLHYWRQVLRREAAAAQGKRTSPLFQRVEVVGHDPTSHEVSQLSGQGGVDSGSFPLAGVAVPNCVPAATVVGVGCRLHLPNGVLLELTGVLEAAWLGGLVMAAGSLPMAAAVAGGRS